MPKYILELRGKAKDVFRMLKLLATTEPMEQDINWWELRAYIMANDRDNQSMPCLWCRRN